MLNVADVFDVVVSFEFIIFNFTGVSIVSKRSIVRFGNDTFLAYVFETFIHPASCATVVILVTVN
jgi:uncharacterized membrane protein